MAITLTNLIPSPSMEGSGWSGGTYSTSYAYDGQYSLRLDGTASTPEVTANTTAAIALNPSHIYYARVYGYQTTKSAGTVGFYWPIAEPNFQEGIPLGDAGKWNLYSGRNGRSSFSSGSYQFRLDYNNSNAAGTMYFDGCMLLDLTEAYGAGNEPSQAWCDENIPYFEGNLIVDFEQGDILDFAYTGGAQEVQLVPGRYKLEVWGAQGGYRSSSSYGGKGGYSVGELTVNAEITAIVQVGGSGNTGGADGGYNGGGARSSYKGGGGATDIRLGTDSVYARVIVAGGGGSDGASSKGGGYGGGTSGQSRTENYGTGGYGGTQTGVSSSSWQTDTKSSSLTTQAGAYAGFGFGGNGIYRSSGYGGAGGGGWYGGSGAYPDSSGDDDRGGGGGSGFVWTGSNAPSGYLLTAEHYLSNASTKAGNTSFLSPDGVSQTGHTGDGYARITVLEIFQLVPDTPQNLRQTGQTLDSISMAWDSVDADGYKLYRDGALYATLTATSYTDTGLLPNESHSYAILAYNENGDGDLSAAVTMSTEFAYYTITPVFHTATITPNPANINEQAQIVISVTDELVILEPEYWYAGEIMAGE